MHASTSWLAKAQDRCDTIVLSFCWASLCKKYLCCVRWCQSYYYKRGPRVHYYIFRHAPWKHKRRECLGEKGLLLSSSPGAYIILSAVCWRLQRADLPAAAENRAWNRISLRCSVEAVPLWLMPRVCGKQSLYPCDRPFPLRHYRFPV